MPIVLNEWNAAKHWNDWEPLLLGQLNGAKRSNEYLTAAYWRALASFTTSARAAL
jgi:hypothetical protein